MGISSTPPAQTWRWVEPNHIVDEFFARKSSLLKFASGLSRPIRKHLCARPFLMRVALLENIAGLHAHGFALLGAHQQECREN
jgi:hypothetical protein